MWATHNVNLRDDIESPGASVSYLHDMISLRFEIDQTYKTQ